MSDAKPTPAEKRQANEQALRFMHRARALARRRETRCARAC
jgi:hypothetical protein